MFLFCQNPLFLKIECKFTANQPEFEGVIAKSRLRSPPQSHPQRFYLTVKAQIVDFYFYNNLLNILAVNQRPAFGNKRIKFFLQRFIVNGHRCVFDDGSAKV